MSEEVASADALLRENVELRAQLAAEHARMAALLEACAAVAAFVESYAPSSNLAQTLPTFYGIFRVYGKNARAAVEACRGQADALVGELEAARAVVAATRSFPNKLMSEALFAYDQATKAREG